MLTVAYLANQFPAPVEPYVAEEIEELRNRGVRVIAGSVRAPHEPSAGCPAEIVLLPLNAILLLRGLWLCLRRWTRIAPIVARIVFEGREGPIARLKAIAHTWLGVCYAVLLADYEVEHIHVHHGYFGSWVAMVAARLLGAGFSLTLHGSDLLLHATYLDVKLQNCAFCLTVSEYNRHHILQHYPEVDAGKVIVARLGVDVSQPCPLSAPPPRHEVLTLLAVGRLHEVKDHAFLIRACAQLRARNLRFECSIAGEGPERRHLEALIRKHGLEDSVTLLGHIPREQIDSLYQRADVVVLTSRSEGLPLVLMEAMARGKVVLVPAITGIPELVVPGMTGFLYEPGSMGDFVGRLSLIHSLLVAPRGEDSSPHRFKAPLSGDLDWMRHAARVQVLHNFNRNKNLETFGDLFLGRIAPLRESIPDENFVLQQI
jgi:colanic acid/amylovoran biosynthesis glycosyltransferase